MITVFTPTYNRAYIISNLYRSLLRQTDKEFEWIIVDDGSSDNTWTMVNTWVGDGHIKIRTFRQDNGGKYRAINRGVKEAEGELFFIVDSDDYLADDAIEKIQLVYNGIRNDNAFAGVCGLRCYPDGSRIGGECDFGIIDCSSLDFRYKHKIKGDMAEVIRTVVMREYPIPEFDGELFCPEAVFFNRIAKKYKLRYFYEKIYICQYLSDGLTAKITKLRMSSPRASMTCYSELAHCKIPITQKIKAAINYWRFSFCSSISFAECFRLIGYNWLLLAPFGYAFHIIDKSRCKI